MAKNHYNTSLPLRYSLLAPLALMLAFAGPIWIVSSLPGMGWTTPYLAIIAFCVAVVVGGVLILADYLGPDDDGKAMTDPDAMQ